MPGQDRTGPNGQGTLTGRGLGSCGGGLRRGFGRRMGWRCWGKFPYNEPVTLTKAEEKKILEAELNEVILAVDEFESIRLKDLNGLEQEECAKKINISQPTFHRLVLSARKKIADAIINGKAIRIEGGNYKI